ncbi:MAG TPA: ATP-binding protein [Hyphomicrobiaceae bacterium]|nr:ATP-binding protein [Hyphomicrobiaceae bacterium]
MAATGSLRLRLLGAALLAIVLALLASGVLLSRLFALHVERRAAAEMVVHLDQLLAGLEVEAGGAIQVTGALADPRFAKPYGGLYWQIDSPPAARQRSRSLWDFELTLPHDGLATGETHRHNLTGPAGSALFAIERAFSMGPGAAPISFRLTLATDRREIDQAAAEFRDTLATSLLVLGVSLLAAFAAMLHFGLAPFRRLGGALQDVHSGKRPKVEGAYPVEVAALVVDVNRLLDKERETIARAGERAGDLAHGFKTPLAVLGAVARDLERDGKSGAATEIEQQVETMSRHVRRELARARFVGRSGVNPTGIAVGPVVERVIAALERISGERPIAWTVTGPDDCRFAGDETDLFEVIGNLCENASKWARRRADVSIGQAAALLTISVSDDGPGIPEGAEAEALLRGRRIDESGSGSGLGLSIVAKTVDAYGGSISLARGPLGGLMARVVLPAADAAGDITAI